MTASTSQATEARYSVFALADAYRVWDARDERFVQDPTVDYPTKDFASEGTARQVCTELNTTAPAAETPDAPAETPTQTGHDDEPTATAPTTPARPVMLGHQRKTPRTRSAKPGTHVQRAIAAYRNRRVLTVDAFMKSLGADGDTIRRYRSPLGRKIAQAWRAATGSEPQRSGWAVAQQRLIPVFAYERGQAQTLADVTRAYRPTMHLIGA